MTGIRTGIGLFSGIDIAGLTDQLIAAERAPANRIESRIANFQAVDAGLQALEANVLTLGTSIATLGQKNTFDSFQVGNSSPGQLTVSTDGSAALGNYAFQTLRLASTEQRLSKGFANSDTQKIGAGSIAISQGGELTTATRLDTFNGGDGIQRGSIRITDRSGSTATVDLSAAFTIDDVLNAINDASGINVTASASGGSLVLTDTSGSTSSNLKVEEVGNGTTASDLGILQSAGANTLTGSEVYYVTQDFTFDQLNDSNGIFKTQGSADLKITAQDGTAIEVNLDSVFSLSELLDAINTQSSNGGKVTASLSNGRLSLTDNTGGAGTLTVEDVNGAKVVNSLGLDNAATGNTLTGDRLLAGIGSRLLRNLNGGQGISTPGQITVTDRTGKTATLDLSGAESLDEVLTAINSAVDDSTLQALSLKARIDANGTGIQIVDTSGATASNLTIADVGGGTTAADLGITVDDAVSSIESGSLSLRHVNATTSLSTYAPDGGPVQTGSFLIIDSAGNQASISISTNAKTIGDVLQRINAATGVQVTASLNDTGDGFVITDDAGGAGTLQIKEVTGNVAAELRILGQGVVGGGGSQEISSRQRTVIDVSADDTLDSLVSKINSTSNDLSASVVNDGSSFNAFRLTLTSRTSGSAGRFVIDTGSLDLGLTTSTTAQDALLQIGSNPATSFLRSSTSNQFDKVGTGINVTVQAVSTTPAQVSITRDSSRVTSALQNFVSAYNSFITTKDTLTKFDATDPTQSGPLQGQGIVLRVETRLNALINHQFGSSGSIRSLSDLGIQVTTGGQLQFDQSVFNDAVASDSESVRSFFLISGAGAADGLSKTLDSLTNTVDGVFTLQRNSIGATIDSMTNRVAEIDALLAIRKERLLQNFINMESAIGAVQSQQSALSALLGNGIASSSGSSK
ncbi:flagellar filament capping protein FliD [bacterium]|nr:flagellar filament capping protein FliD [bacterium]